jgi:hypothetical protein
LVKKRFWNLLTNLWFSFKVLCRTMHFSISHKQPILRLFFQSKNVRFRHVRAPPTSVAVGQPRLSWHEKKTASYDFLKDVHQHYKHSIFNTTYIHVYVYIYIYIYITNDQIPRACLCKRYLDLIKYSWNMHQQYTHSIFNTATHIFKTKNQSSRPWNV